jgi:hypothetical protein
MSDTASGKSRGTRPVPVTDPHGLTNNDVLGSLDAEDAGLEAIARVWLFDPFVARPATDGIIADSAI